MQSGREMPVSLNDDVISEIMAELALHGDYGHDLSMFRLGRLTTT